MTWLINHWRTPYLLPSQIQPLHPPILLQPQASPSSIHCIPNHYVHISNLISVASQSFFFSSFHSSAYSHSLSHLPIQLSLTLLPVPPLPPPLILILLIPRPPSSSLLHSPLPLICHLTLPLPSTHTIFLLSLSLFHSPLPFI